MRFVALPTFPPGINHDEVAEVLIAEDIWRGQHALFFAQAYGQEPLFLYWVALSLGALGRNVLALRFVTAAAGLLTVSGCVALARRMFDREVAWMTGGVAAALFWAVFWSRLGLRGMMLPLCLSLAGAALWRALRTAEPHPLRYAALAGVGWGLSAYTYLAARGVPLLLAAWLPYLAAFHRDLWRRRWRALALMIAVAALVAAPLVFYLWHMPALQVRVQEVDAPLRALLGGNPRLVLENALRVMGMFTWRGDATERNNLPGRPLFAEPLWALAGCGGLLALLWRWRDPRCAFVLLWLAALTLPTLVTTEAPNFVRVLGALPAIALLPALGWRAAERLPLKLDARLWSALFGGALLLNVASTSNDYFFRWPRVREVAFVWQWGLDGAADWLDAHPGAHEATLAGLSNTAMDDPTLALLTRDPVRARWCDPGSPLGGGGALLIPAQGGEFLAPHAAPLSRALAERVNAWAIESEIHPYFSRYRLPPLQAAAEAATPFQGGATLLAVEGLTDAVFFQPGETVLLFSLWEAADGYAAYPPLKVFVHWVDASGAIRAQHDGLDCPAQFWRPGDRVIQQHTLALPGDLAPGRYTVRLGLYHPETLAAYPRVDGAAFVEWKVEVSQ